MTSLDLHRLLAIENCGWHALTEGTGSDFYDALMADDCVMVLAGGTVLERDEVLISMAAAEPWARYDIRNPEVIELGTDTAALVYRVSAMRPGEDTFRAINTSTYRLVRGHPKLVLYQQTHITQ